MPKNREGRWEKALHRYQANRITKDKKCSCCCSRINKNQSKTLILVPNNPVFIIKLKVLN